MKKILAMVLMAALAFTGCIGTSTTPETPIMETEACLASGGEWVEFPNACVDSCEYAANPDLMCAQVLTYSCDCGADKCWNGTTCVGNLETLEMLCIDSGGIVTTQMCCLSTEDFYVQHWDIIGACGCTPENSHEVKVCECPKNEEWNGTTCDVAGDPIE